MGFLSNLFSATVKISLTPVAVVKDATEIAIGEEPNTTKKLLDSASEDVSDALDDLTGGS